MTEEKKTNEDNQTEAGKKEAKTTEKTENETNPIKKKGEDLKPGMTVRVYQRIKELNLKGEEKERVQYFEGIIIAKKHGREAGATITVRKTSNGIGVEKIFPLNLPSIDKIEIKKEARTRRAKLGYLKKGFKRKIKETTVK